MNIGMIGAGYVGLVTGACFAEMGNVVTCVDTDARKIDALNNGRIPIHEAGLDAIVIRNHAAGRLKFTSQLRETVAEADILFIAVGTPPNEDGSADLSHVLAVARSIGECLDRPMIIVNKSTVPVGTAEKVRATIEAEFERLGKDVPFDVVSNPEFLKEGAAVDDFMRPDRVIVGTESERAAEVMRRLYAPFTRNHERILFMGIRDAEMTKYAANAMLATKISFMNEIANICERLGVDVENVRLGIGSDTRIGYSFIYPGCGYGGSCFPKDVKALIRSAREAGLTPEILDAVESRNAQQKLRLFEKITTRFGPDLSAHTFGVWGLAFKPGTDDVREASALTLLHTLIGAGARVSAYDPVAMEATRSAVDGELIESGRLLFAADEYEAVRDASAMVLVTEWTQFRDPDFERIRGLLRQPVIFDGRNQYSPALLRANGFEYFGIGR
ncbi:MAG TPA: UDP-glucose/GDP-mannose dehydrogenase family protein [Burkholderiales bacterium]|nr:UDP-glucose/GDP-mannose dehydrogenase family protein [Burkholderiales bacterium]